MKLVKQATIFRNKKKRVGSLLLQKSSKLAQKLRHLSQETSRVLNSRHFLHTMPCESLWPSLMIAHKASWLICQPRPLLTQMHELALSSIIFSIRVIYVPTPGSPWLTVAIFMHKLLLSFNFSGQSLTQYTPATPTKRYLVIILLIPRWFEILVHPWKIDKIT